MELGLAEAAERLGVSRRHVNDLVSSGVLSARRVSGVYLVSSSSVNDYEVRRRQAGRGWSPQTAWSTLFVLSGVVPVTLPKRTLVRVRQRLSRVTGAELARAVGGRYVTHRFHADGALVQDELIATGRQAAELIGSDLIEDKRRVDGYLRPGVTYSELTERFLLVDDPSGPDLIRETTVELCDPLPVAVVAADLALALDARERAAGEETLEELLRRWRERR